MSLYVPHFIWIYTLYWHYIDGERTQSGVFPRLHLCLLRISSMLGDPPSRWEHRSALPGSIREDPSCRSRGIFLSSSTQDSFPLSPGCRGHVWTNFPLLSVKNSLGEMKFVNAVDISTSVFKLDCCVRLGHPKVTHFSLHNLTHHRGAVIEFHFIATGMSFYGQICKHHYIDTLLWFL